MRFYVWIVLRICCSYLFDKQIRNKLRKAKRCGVEVYQGTANDIPLFYDFIKKKHNRNLKYYQDFNEAFSKKSKL